MAERLPYPTDRDILEAREREAELRMDTAFPARVQSYDPDLQVADLVPLIRKQVPQPDGSHVMEELPVLPCVPVCFPRMGAWFLSFPVAPGDTGLVIVCSGAIGHWRVGDGDVTDPGDLRRNHIAHSVFLPMGLVPRARKLTKTGAAGTTDPPNPQPSGVVLGSDAANGPRVLIHLNGTVEIETGGAVVARVESNGSVRLGGVAGELVALSNLVNDRLETIRAAFNSHTHAVTGSSATGGAVTGAAAAPASPITSLSSVAASKVRAT